MIVLWVETGIRSNLGDVVRSRNRYESMLQFICNTESFQSVTMNEISSGSPRHPEGSVDAGFNLGHKVGDGTFFDVILLIMFNPEVSCEGNKVQTLMTNYCR